MGCLVLLIVNSDGAPCCCGMESSQVGFRRSCGKWAELEGQVSRSIYTEHRVRVSGINLIKTTRKNLKLQRQLLVEEAPQTPQ
jgi:hypothetical protein